MLISLFIKNILLIKQVEIDLKDGLCVISGETGAGKSILLNSILFCLGQKTKIQKTSLLRPSETLGEVTCIFDISLASETKRLLQENNIEISADNTLIVRRLINADGKSKILINNTPCTITFLTAIGESIFEFHTQSQQSKLTNDINHDDFLIQYGTFTDKVKEISAIYSQIQTLQDKINKELTDAENFKKEYEYNIEALKELKILAIEPNEDMELETKRAKIKSQEREFSTTNEIAKKICSEKFREAIVSSIRSASILTSVDLQAKLDEMLSIYDDIDFLVQKLLSNCEFSDHELEKIDDRMHAIRDIARKHRISTSQICEFINDLQNKVKHVENSDANIKKYRSELAKLEGQYLVLSENLSQTRLKYAKILSKEITKQLGELGFIDGDFVIDVATNKSREFWTAKGFDKVKFIARTNKGMQHDSISKIASGGEISRFMLALKTALSNVKKSGLIIFDEIDQGIGGQTALALASKLQELSKKSQILLITHQATIAAKADLHIKIFKQNNTDITTTELKILENDAKIEEIARMLLGDSKSPQALQSAKLLLQGR